MLSGGSFITLSQTVCTQATESLWRRVTRLKDSRGYSIPKIWTILKSREFQFGEVSEWNETPDFWTIFKLKEGVSSKILPLFLEFQKSGVFQNRGNFTLGEFQTSPWNCLYSGSWVDLKESNRTEKSPRLFDSKNQDYFKTAGMFGGGSFIPLLEAACRQQTESLWRRVTDWEIPAVILFQKSGLY